MRSHKLTLLSAVSLILSLACSSGTPKGKDTGHSGDTGPDTAPEDDTGTDTDTEPDTDGARYALSETDTRMRLLNVSFSDVDVYLNSVSTPVASSFPYYATSLYIDTVPGTYSFYATDVGSTDVIAALEDEVLSVATANSIIIHMRLSEHHFFYGDILRLIDDVSDPGEGMARVRPVSLSVLAFSGNLSGGGQDWSLGLYTANDAQLVPSGVQSWTLDTNGDGFPEYTYSFSLASGDTANILMMDYRSPTDDIVPTLLVSHTTSPPAGSSGSYFDASGAIQAIVVLPD